MGFGLLTFGYFCVNIIGLYPPLSPAILLGYILILIGMYRLAPYGKYLKTAYYISYLSLPFAVFYGYEGFVRAGILPNAFAIPEGGLALFAMWGYFVFSLTFHFFLLVGIARVLGELQLYSMRNAAFRNLTIVFLYQVVYLAVNLIPYFSQKQALFSLPVTLLRLIFVFFNVWLFFRCHRLIAPQYESGKTGKEENSKTHSDGKENSSQ